MNICFPVKENKGIGSNVFGHFGSAPYFLVVDSETMQESEIENGNHGHKHGSCSPVHALGENTVDVVIAGGMGRGALIGLSRLGIEVFKAEAETVAENLEKFKAEKLSPLSLDHSCTSHGQSNDCSHGGGHGHSKDDKH
jgi:predicted Fe-Mo cluster-binding NifX family protein